MMCRRCKREIPPGALACPCFMEAQDEELLRGTVARFYAGEFGLFVTDETHHFLNRTRKGLTFCKDRRYKTRPKGRVIQSVEEFEKLSLSEVCSRCYDQVRQRLRVQAAMEGVQRS